MTTNIHPGQSNAAANSPSFFIKSRNFVCVWVVYSTPRVITYHISGAYSLGYAYRHKIMFSIHSYVIEYIVFPRGGYLAVGAAMPYICWYADKGVWFIGGIAGCLLYSIIEKIVILAAKFLVKQTVAVANWLSHSNSPA